MEPKDFIDEVEKNTTDKENTQKEKATHQSIETAKTQVIDAMVQSTKANMKHRENTTTKVDVQNDLAERSDVAEAVSAINNLAVLMLSQGQNKPSVNMIDGTDLGQRFADLGKTLTDLLTEVRNDSSQDKNMQSVVKQLDAQLKQLKNLQVAPDPDLKKSLANVEKALKSLDMKPQVNVAAPKVIVQGKELDLSPLETLLSDIKTTLSENKPQETDFEPVLAGLGAVQDAITGLRFPVANYVLPFKDSNGKDAQVQLDSSGNVPTAGGLSKTGTGYSVSSQTALTTTATVSGSAGKFGGGMFINLNSAPAYIQVFDTTGAVTLGTTPPTFVIPIPANATAANGVGFVLPLDVGIAITNGIKVAATTTATGATTVSTGLVGFVYYA